ncbi:MAG: protein kinase [Verrucomicrobiota bacterium]|nr:protein kinase [Verrucomicrobiota bacterium]
MEQNIYLGRYQLLLDESGAPQRMGSNPTGSSYKAQDVTTRNEVIVQTVPAAGLRAAVREKLEAEALAAKQINHLNIPALCSFGFEGDDFVYVSEFFEGPSTQEWVGEHGPLPLGAVLRVASQMVGAIGAAAFHGIFHYALTPANVLLVPGQTTDGDWPLIKVTNFLGVAPSLSRHGETAGGVGDAVNFASPEQLANGAVDFRSEIYSVGGTLWFLLSGAPPFAGAATIETAAGIPSRVKSLLARMLATDPADRPLDPIALQEEIQGAIAQIERRDVIAGKVGMVPVAATIAAPAPLPAAAVPSVPRRAVPWKPLALAATLLLAAALASMILPAGLRPSRLFGGDSAPVGVPIGVTDDAVTPAQVASVSDVAPATGTDEPAILTSTASADTSPEAATHHAVQQPEVAASQTAQNTRGPQLEPAPPAEGPAESSASSTSGPAQSADVPNNIATVAEATPTNDAETNSESARPDVRKAEPPATPTTSARTAKVVQPSPRNRRFANSGPLPPLPPRAVRAQYLGTTPDGELVFGLPSDEKAFYAPGSGGRPRRHSRRVIREPVSELPPVLPALPPDE